MERIEKQKKCSSKKHENINAVFFCQECKLYMCNKCLNLHNELFDNHTKYDINKHINDIFTGICQEDNHNSPLVFFCKTHDQLCCAACIVKIKGKEGKHNECNICAIEDIKDEKKLKLNEMTKYLEDVSKTIDNSLNELKKSFQIIFNSKEKLKLNISNIFTKIRNIIN